MGVIRSFINFIKDALWVTKLCFTTIWFWIPIIFGVYICIQPLLALAIHPLTLLIVPAGLIIYMILTEDKRTAQRYGLKKNGTENAGAIRWNVDKSLDEYMRILNKRQMQLSELPKPESEEE